MTGPVIPTAIRSFFWVQLTIGLSAATEEYPR